VQIVGARYYVGRTVRHKLYAVPSAASGNPEQVLVQELKRSLTTISTQKSYPSGLDLRPGNLQGEKPDCSDFVACEEGDNP
jgi:hypothetical protein